MNGISSTKLFGNIISIGGILIIGLCAILVQKVEGYKGQTSTTTTSIGVSSIGVGPSDTGQTMTVPVSTPDFVTQHKTLIEIEAERIKKEA